MQAENRGPRDVAEGDAGHVQRDDGRPRSNGSADVPSFSQLADKVGKRLESVGTSLRTLWNVRKDRAQLAVRRRIQNVAIVVVGALAVGTAVIHGVILLVGGTAAGLARLFGGRVWLGDLLAGVLFLALIGGGIALALSSWNRSQLAKQKKKYAELHRKRGQSATP